MTMEREYTLFLQSMSCALRGEKLPEQPEATAAQWEQVFQLGRDHRVLPMVFEAVHSQAVLQNSPMLKSVRGMARQDVYLQTVKTAEFLTLYRALRAEGLTPLVVKGLICRNLYPKPDQRPSSDEDLLIPREQFEAAHRALLDFGMRAETENLASSHEISYRKQGGLHIELHQSPFPPDSAAYGHLNRFFEAVHSRAVETVIDGVSLLTMAPTEHLLYLIFHAFKHFLHSGFGIRQVCDIALFAGRYEAQIDWEWVFSCCRKIRGEKFAAAIFRIGEKYLGTPAACPGFRELEVDEKPMLMDLLASGIYGDSELSRKHSATITLSAAEGRKNGLVRSLFPSVRSLRSRYPYLEAHPLLLPAAWVSRLAAYGRETLTRRDSGAAESLRIGAERVALLKRYGILEE